MIRHLVKGAPRTAKSGSDNAGEKDWKGKVEKETIGLDRMKGPCSVRVDFILPRGSYDVNNPEGPYGGDVDNLAMVVLDALKMHVLPLPAGDNAVVELTVTKRKAREGEETGASIEVIELAPDG